MAHLPVENIPDKRHEDGQAHPAVDDGRDPCEYFHHRTVEFFAEPGGYLGHEDGAAQSERRGDEKGQAAGHKGTGDEDQGARRAAPFRAVHGMPFSRAEEFPKGVAEFQERVGSFIDEEGADDQRERDHEQAALDGDPPPGVFFA